MSTRRALVYDTSHLYEPFMTSHDEPEDPSSSTQELPRVVLGEHSEEAVEPPRRVIPGRISLTTFGWLMSGQVLGAGALSAIFAWSGEEWSFWMVLLVWGLMWLWKWLYMEAWTYQRSLLKHLSALIFLGMSCAMAWMCHDRAAEQFVWRGGELIERAHRPELECAAVLLVGSALVLASHLVWFGRGWRVRQRRAVQDSSGEEE